ncbi:MAG: TRAP transporter substrate-binding protein DctP [Treponema sp.]|jgi:TRAP-type C4-dicarboxylate transport system substrate-binding protein|nr:TRAP transporter substrate-binding protein DctP [Treponema sp.]
MKKIAFLFALFIIFSLGMVYAQRGTAREDVINIRFASPLPRNSEWGRALDRLAAEWQQASNNQIQVVVSHDGREGSELRMLSSLSSNSIQVGIFTSAGISEICPAVINLSIPFLIGNEAEFDLVLREILPVLETRVKDDFIILAWSKGGWVYLFSREQILSPADLRRQRIASSPELTEMNAVFRGMGFNLIDTDITAIGQRLASGAVNTIYLIPSAVAPMQLHRSLNHMMELPIAPIMGAIVINRVTWNRISPAHQQQLLRITRRIAGEFDESVTRTEANALASMSRSGLSVNTLTQAQQDLWRTELLGFLPQFIGNTSTSTYDRDIYNRINQILQRSRSGQ